MKLSQISATFAALAAISVTPLAHAQANPHLAEAQKAYAAVDYETTRSQAKAALEQGGNDRAATAELYLLWATAAAALDQADEARVAFSYALAANPELKLERSLSPKVRAPYLEARGNASSADGKPPLALDLLRHKQELELTLRDRLSVAASIELSTRSDDTQTFARRRFDAATTRRLPLPGGAELQYFVRVLDRRSNVLLEVGTADEPRRLTLSASPPMASPPQAARGPSPMPYYITAGGLAALGLAAGGVATAMYLRREDAARAWNGPDCEQPGATRQEQCGGVDDRRRSSEHLAIGFAAGGGALLVGSLVSLLLAPSSPSRTNLALDAGPGSVTLRLGTDL
jgi:tetratricopeptide (TPR) repeat protein